MFDPPIGAGSAFSKQSELRTSPIFLNFVEAIVNLFMKLQASNLTKLDNLDVKLKRIEIIT